MDLKNSDEEIGGVKVAEHAQTLHGFFKATSWSVITIVVILVLMAIFLL